MSENPQKNPMTDQEKEKKIREVFDEVINPGVAMHGGFVEFLEIKDKKVFVRMSGGCQGCGMVSVTLRQGIEATIKDALPEIEEVVDVTHHHEGHNPYYGPSDV